MIRHTSGRPRSSAIGSAAAIRSARRSRRLERRPAPSTSRSARSACRPAIVAIVVPHDLNIVVERLGPASEPFDLILATNILVYYDPFEQALALANVSAMLRPGGVFVTNYAVSPRSPLESPAGFVTTTFWDRQRNFDTLFWYRRR